MGLPSGRPAREALWRVSRKGDERGGSVRTFKEDGSYLGECCYGEASACY
jgi:hypothetical protein